MSDKDSEIGMVISGAAATQCVDSSGEVVDIKGMDCSQFDDDAGILLNWEHEPGEKGASTIVGRVTYLKKIYAKDDCEDEDQEKYWDRCAHHPFVYVKCRLFDGSGHEEAKAIAAIVRDNVAHKEPVAPRFSVEGSTLTRDGNHITESIFRRLAITMRPCNRTAVSGLLSDPHADGVSKSEYSDPFFQYVGGQADFEPQIFVKKEPVDRNKLIVDLSTLAALAKALEAGSADGAPGTRTGSSALQSEDRALKGNVLAAIRDYGDHPFSRGQFRTFAKARLPEVSDEYLDRFADMAEEFRLKKHVREAVPGPKAPDKVARSKRAPAPPVEDLDDDEEDLDAKAPPIERGTYRGEPVPVKKGVGKPVFDPKEGVLHTPIGSFRAYLPKHDGPLADANYKKLLSSPGVEKVMDHAIGNWLKLHRRLKAGKLPAEVVAHAVMFSQLSPNTPVPTQELQYARLHDAMKETGLDPTKPGFSAIMPNLLAQDKPDVGPKLAAAAIAADPRYRTGTQLGVQRDAAGNKMGDPSAATGRYPGEYLSISPLLANKMKNVTRYHEIHDKVVDLVQRHRHDMLGGVAELMRGKNAGNLARAAEKRATAKGLPAPAAAAPALSIPGLKVKTGLYTYGMLGGGNSIVPDTHFIRNMFGLDLKKDKGTIEYLKRQMWNSNNVHLVKAYNDWYVKNHPAAQYTLKHPKWGKHFAGDPSNVAFPAFWRHWITIRPHEHFLGMGRASGHNEATVHEPYWAAVRPLLEKAQFELDLPARTAEVHRRYCDLYGEVPASMMYYQHLVPELLAEADQRQRTANTYSFLAKTQLIEEAGIELRKSVSDALDPVSSCAPVVRQVSAMIQGKSRPIGRYMIHEGRVHHLEDYHGILASVLPEGPVDTDMIARLHGLSWAPDLTVEPHEAPQTNPGGTAGNGTPPAPLLEVAESQPPPPAPVFEYTRAGHAAPHVLEFGMDGKAALDGSALDDAELALIMDNADRGLATIKYRQPPVTGGELAKSARDPGEALQNLRRLLGNDHPDVSALASHIYEDPMVPGVGNKYAYQKFRAENRPGAYLSMDLNDFKNVNDSFGHDAGDRAISGAGAAFRDAAAKVGTGKLFRPGGDEFVAHFPTHEEAALFARHATSGLDAIPPVATQVGSLLTHPHRLTTSIGIGNNFADADRALGHAKARKIDPITGQKSFPAGRTPHLAHSLVPGHEGGIELHDERPPAPRRLPTAA